MTSLNSRIAPLVVGGAGLSAAVVAFAVEPTRTSWLPRCPFHALTGLYCPGCGATRSLHDLTHGDITGALNNNAIFVAVLPMLVMLWLLWLKSAGTTQLSIGPKMGYAMIAVLMAFAVTRNLPGFEFLAPIA